MNFWHLVRVVKSRIWIILGLVILTQLVILIAAPEPHVSYEATCYMSPTAQAMRGGVTTATDAGSQGARAAADRNVVLSNLILLAKSGEVAQRASDFLALPEEEQRSVSPGLPAYRQINLLMYAPGKPFEPQNWHDALQVSPVVNYNVGKEGTTSDVLAIRIKIPNGSDAPYVANAIGVAFSETYQVKSREDLRKYSDFLKSSTDESRDKLRDIELRIAEYRQTHQVAAADSELQSAVNTLSQTEAARDAARAEVDAATASLKDIDHQLASQPLVQTVKLPTQMNPRVAKLQEELAQAESDLRMMSLRYNPAHTTYKALEKHIQDLKKEIAREGATFGQPKINDLHSDLIKQRSGVATTLASASARLADLNKQVSAARSRVVSLAGAQRELVDLMREQQRANDEYTLFAQKLAQSRIADREFEKYGSVVSYGWASDRTLVGPVIDGPRKRVLLLYGIVLSLVLGIGASIWLDSIDNRIKNGTDVEQLLKLPTMGLIPALTGKDGQLPKLTHIFPLSATAESYRILRTNILFAHRDHPFKTLMVATGKPGQGATTTICNLAIALAQIGKKIILIDADMRRPALHKFFDMSNDVGLSTLLKGKGNPLECMRQTEVENLIVIPAGPTPLNASELLASDRLWEITQILKEHCDFVLFDTPSTIVFSDGPVLASWLDTVLFVMSANQVPRGAEDQALKLLKNAKANIIGAVVNRMAPENVDSCYFYSHYYASSNMDLDVNTLTGGNGKKSLKPSKSIPELAEDLEPIPSGSSEMPATEDTTSDNPFPD